MVSVQELYEFTIGLISEALNDIEAAEVLYREGLLARALYHIEQGSEKLTKVFLCLSFLNVSDKNLSIVIEPDDFVKKISHDPVKLLESMLFIGLKSVHQLPVYRSPDIEPLIPESLRGIFKDEDLRPKTLILYLARYILARYIKFTLSSACLSDDLKSSELCRSINRLNKKAEKCEKTENENICLNLVKNVFKIIRLLSNLMLVKDVWRSVKPQVFIENLAGVFEESLNTQTFKNLVISGLKEELKEKMTKHIDPDTYKEVLQIMELYIHLFTKYAVTVIRSFITTFTLFYFTSPLYNVIRYPVSTKKHYICRDKGLRKFKEVEKLCSKTFISSKDVSFEETYMKEFFEKAINMLKEATNYLNQILSNLKIHQSM
ncbi:MAG: hypothetical protein QXU89_02755 [Desulfurococcaceae archaeon]